MRSVGLAMMLVACGSAAGGAVAAGPEPSLPAQKSVDPAAAAWLDARVAEMDAPDLQTREKATDEVSGDPRMRLLLLERRLCDNGPALSPEQYARLDLLGRRMFGQSAHGAMGVSFGGADRGEGVAISATIDGFDSRRVLRSGDTILAIDGQPINTQADARAAIVSHDPGDEVTLDVIRRGERMVTRMRLGSYHNLQQANTLDDRVLSRAWALRCRRRSGAIAPTVIEPPIQPAGWSRLIADEESRQQAAMEAMRRRDPATAGEPEGPPPQLTVGGALRNVMSNDQTFSLGEDAAAAVGRDQQAIMNQIALTSNEIVRNRMLMARERDPKKQAVLQSRMDIAQRRLEVLQREQAKFFRNQRGPVMIRP